VVVPLDEAPQTLRGRRFDLVTNIQSFTECTLASIRWWLDIVSQNDVEYLLIVPSTRHELLSVEPDGQRLDFLVEIQARGFELTHKLPAYELASSLQKFGVYRRTHYWLFKNTAA
jgi:hypothetical protein